MKIYCLYDDGNHIACFDSHSEAEAYALEECSRYWDIEAEEYEPKCDCKNQNVSLGK